MNVRHCMSASQWRLPVEDPSHVGEGRRTAQRLACAHGFDETQAGRVAIVATELATNLLRHAGSGELLLQVLEDGEDCSLELLAVDRGPGMADVDACLRDGHSTAGTAGNGLGAVARLSSLFDLWSAPGQGAVCLARVSRDCAVPATAVATGPRLEFGAVSVGLRGETACGDAWRLALSDVAISLMVTDGLGHGLLAADAALAVGGAFQDQPFDPPAVALQRWHRAAAGTRGAAVAHVVADTRSGQLRFAGIGNVSACVVVDGRAQGMASHNGILGVGQLRTREFAYDWPAGSRLVAHTDGVSSRWSLSRYPGLAARHPGIVAGLLYRDHGRDRDDVTVVVLGPRS
jgi:anti-sigma regulatory factor (Ser/Thr protein kinase)